MPSGPSPADPVRPSDRGSWAHRASTFPPLSRPHRIESMRLFALRGATSARANEVDAILSATEELMRELLSRNQLEPDALVSCIFTLTADLDAEFPAVAARRMGLNQVPLLCARERSEERRVGKECRSRSS